MTRLGPGSRPAAGTAHFIGIGGAGMAPVAQLLAARGWLVSGSDARDGATLARLRSLDIAVHLGHDPAQVPNDATVVISTAVSEDNPELRAARERGLPVIHRSEALVLAAEGRDFIAIAGAHGKTTTSAMLAVALDAAGGDPSFAIGGRVLDLDASARLGSGSAFVAEADESDGSFLTYRPRIAVVTSVEPDHLDHYGSAAALHEAFDDFAARVQPGGLLICCADDQGAAELAQRHAATQRVLTYGTSAAPAGVDAHVQLHDVHVEGHRARADLGDNAVRLSLAVGGAHNLRNAAAAWCAGVELGTDPQRLARGLGEFTGTGRRFERRGEAAGVTVVDDYAHHPTEVEATLRHARAAAGEGSGRVLVLFQPHLYSRTATFAASFARALGQADLAIVTDVYGAREEPMPGVTGATITRHMPVDRGRYVAEGAVAARAIASVATAGDLVLTVGAGDVTDLAPVILEELRSKA